MEKDLLTTVDDLPLNLELDEELQSGRMPTCQPETESDDQFDSVVETRCFEIDRELLRADFEAWLK